MYYQTIRNVPITDTETRRTLDELKKHYRTLVSWDGAGDEFNFTLKSGSRCLLRKMCTFRTSQGKLKMLVVCLGPTRINEIFAI